MTDNHLSNALPENSTKPSGDPLLEIRDLAISFQQDGSTIEAVRKVNLTINRGELTALVGKSGSGKSVTANSILKLLPQNSRIDSGSITYKGKELLTMNEGSLQEIRGNRISMIFQEPLSALNPLHKIGKQIMEPIFIHQNLNKEQALHRCIELLSLVGIQNPDKHIEAYPHQLSGGQRQRAMIAMALVNKPDILIADEPTTALDVTIQSQVLDLIRELQEKLNMGVLFITHDLGVVKKIADHVAIMHQGILVETGTSSDIFSNPQHEYTKELLDYNQRGRPQSLKSQDALLDVKQLSVSFVTKTTLFGKRAKTFDAVKNVDFQLKKGETLGIVGESGSGKTTLGLAISRLIPSSGGIFFREENLQDFDRKQIRKIRRNIQIIFQDPFGSLSPRMSVKQIIAEGLTVHENLSSQEVDTRVNEVLTEVALDPSISTRYPHEFSGGQRQRIAIARALILKPDIIILDEPTSALDRSVQKQIIALLEELQQKYTLSYIFITHDLHLVRSIAHSILVMKSGLIIEKGLTENIFNEPHEAYTQELIASAL